MTIITDSPTNEHEHCPDKIPLQMLSKIQHELSQSNLS